MIMLNELKMSVILPCRDYTSLPLIYIPKSFDKVLITSLFILLGACMAKLSIYNSKYFFLLNNLANWIDTLVFFSMCSSTVIIKLNLAPNFN